MNPTGIPVFYGAFSRDVALAETFVVRFGHGLRRRVERARAGRHGQPSTKSTFVLSERTTSCTDKDRACADVVRPPRRVARGIEALE